jgi:hypothetical protein
MHKKHFKRLKFETILDLHLKSCKNDRVLIIHKPLTCFKDEVTYSDLCLAIAPWLPFRKWINTKQAAVGCWSNNPGEIEGLAKQVTGIEKYYDIQKGRTV